MESRRAASPTSGPAEPHPTRRRDPGHRPPAAGRLQRRARHADPEIARAVAAELREAGGGLPGVRALGLASRGRAHPGLDQRPRPDRACRCRGGRARSRGWRPSTAPGRSRPSWSAWSPRRRSRATRTTSPIRDFDPTRDVIERRPRLAVARFSAMAQTKKKRRRKHRGTQGGRIDTRPARGATAQPRRGAGPGAQPRQEEAASPARGPPQPPSWSSAPQEGRRRRGPLRRAARCCSARTRSPRWSRSAS